MHCIYRAYICINIDERNTLDVEYHIDHGLIYKLIIHSNSFSNIIFSKFYEIS